MGRKGRMDRPAPFAEGVAMTEMPNYSRRTRPVDLSWPPAQPAVPRGASDDAGGLLALLWRGFQRWRERQRAVDELMRLDDQALHDIGLSRSEIRSAVADCADPSRPQERRRCR
jgi:uncharacterized protein YjiS (DUF1127 family)